MHHQVPALTGKLAGNDRLTIGPWRILFTPDPPDPKLHVFAIVPRGNTYLVTNDRGYFSTYFPDLTIISEVPFDRMILPNQVFAVSRRASCQGVAAGED